MKYEVKLEGCPSRTVEAADDQSAIRAYNSEMGIISTKRVYKVYATVVETEVSTLSVPEAEVDPEEDDDLEPAADEAAFDEAAANDAADEQDPQTDVYGESGEGEPEVEEDDSAEEPETDVPAEPESEEAPATAAEEPAPVAEEAAASEPAAAESQAEPSPTLRQQLEGLTRTQLKVIGQKAEAEGKLSFDSRLNKEKMVALLEKAGVGPDVV